MGFIRMFTEI